MSLTDDKEDLGCTNVYLCKKCDDAKPRRDFYKGVGQSKNGRCVLQNLQISEGIQQEQKQQEQPVEIQRVKSLIP